MRIAPMILDMAQKFGQLDVNKDNKLNEKDLTLARDLGKAPALVANGLKEGLALFQQATNDLDGGLTQADLLKVGNRALDLESVYGEAVTFKNLRDALVDDLSQGRPTAGPSAADLARQQAAELWLMSRDDMFNKFDKDGSGFLETRELTDNDPVTAALRANFTSLQMMHKDQTGNPIQDAKAQQGLSKMDLRAIALQAEKGLTIGQSAANIERGVQNYFGGQSFERMAGPALKLMA
jgi:hypothetical protein